jgi:hypothetical protein
VGRSRKPAFATRASARPWCRIDAHCIVRCRLLPVPSALGTRPLAPPSRIVTKRGPGAAQLILQRQREPGDDFFGTNSRLKRRGSSSDKRKIAAEEESAAAMTAETEFEPFVVSIMPCRQMLMLLYCSADTAPASASALLSHSS